MSAFEQICLAIPASGALIAVRDASGLRSVGSLGDAPEVGSHLPPDFGMAIECLETNNAVYRDLTDDAQRVLSVGLTMEGVSQVRSAVALPMRAENAIIGLIAVFSRRESSIQPRDINALTRIADFWGPLMADEWFPDGIPTAIAGNVAVADRSARQSPAILHPRKRHNFRTCRSCRRTNAARTIRSRHTNSPSRQTSLTRRSLPKQDSSRVPRQNQHRQYSSLPPNVFLLEAFHSGEPQSFTWFIMLLVFAVLLLPVFLLRSHWKQSNAALRNSAVVSSTNPANPAAAPNTIHSPHLQPLLLPQNNLPRPVSAIPRRNLKHSRSDEELPKPLPDLNTPPPTGNPSSASTTPKPTLPAIIKRILKSPNAATKKFRSQRLGAHRSRHHRQPAAIGRATTRTNRKSRRFEQRRSSTRTPATCQSRRLSTA